MPIIQPQLIILSLYNNWFLIVYDYFVVHIKKNCGIIMEATKMQICNIDITFICITSNMLAVNIILTLTSTCLLYGYKNK